MDSFTIVTPNFNMGRYLEATIQSVVNNLREGDEYFVIDGGSADGSLAVIEKYAPHLAGWVSEPDASYADAIAKGFAKSRAGLQCWINSGDLLLTGALDTARERLGVGNADMIFGDDFYIDEDGRVISFSRGEIGSLRDAMLYGGWTPLQDACFWTRDLYERVEGIDRTLKYAADFDLFLRFAVAGRTRYVPCAFSAFRRHAGQKSIAQMAAYRIERRQRRMYMLSTLGENNLRGCVRSVWHGAAIRYRIHAKQRHWKLPHLTGTPIVQLRAANYQGHASAA